MADKDLEVIKKTKALVKRTYQVTSNSKHYPKKYRYSLVAEMQKRSMDIYKLLFEANRMNIKVYGKQRYVLQSKAVTYCEELMFFIELSYDLGIIGMKRMESWSKDVADIKHMTLAWRSRDRERA